MLNSLMVVGALREDLVFDLDRRDPGGFQLLHRAHDVQGLAKACAGIHLERNIDGRRNVPGLADNSSRHISGSLVQRWAPRPYPPALTI